MCKMSSRLSHVSVTYLKKHLIVFVWSTLNLLQIVKLYDSVDSLKEKNTKVSLDICKAAQIIYYVILP